MRRRRMAEVIGALAAAAALAFSAPGAACAAEGMLTINGTRHVNPRGCYPVDRFPSSVINDTRSIAEVHTGRNCTGQVEELVYPGRTYYTETARSVFIL
ncbi:hypothetical protein [Streptomyces kanamyceticus]|uniref:hypothetical protein n=1 Tax=Streptomyces kanamyceticus TaxID=1967 RepID=UPI0037DDDD40